MFDSVPLFLYTASTETTFLRIMTEPKNYTAFLTVRISQDNAAAFRRRAKEFGGTSEVVRAMVEAFIDDRITIKPDPNRKSLYQQ